MLSDATDITRHTDMFVTSSDLGMGTIAGIMDSARREVHPEFSHFATALG